VRKQTKKAIAAKPHILPEWRRQTKIEFRCFTEVSNKLILAPLYTAQKHVEQTSNGS